MAFDATPGGDPRGPWCKACRHPIGPGQRSVHVSFNDDADMTGAYHEPCSKPFRSLAHVLNMTPWSRF